VLGGALAVSSCWVDIGELEQPSAGGTGGNAAGTGGAGTGGAGGPDSSTGGAGTGGTGGPDASTGGVPTGGTAGAASCSACGAAACVCVPKAPAGYRYVRIASGKSPAACPAEYPKLSVVGTGATDTGCGACGCGQGVGFSCGVKVQFYSDTACTTATSSQTASGDTCIPKGGAAFKSQLVPSGGSCPPSAPVNPPSFDTTTTLCASEFEPVDCVPGTACVAAATSPFEPGPCVLSDNPAITSCPPEYPIARTFATGFDDKRQCEGCACAVDPPTVGCAGASGFVTPCTAACGGCGGGAGSGSTTCVPTSFGDVKLSNVNISALGSCKASGAATTKGSVTTTGSRVACCAS
jgi:hypothetical protein